MSLELVQGDIFTAHADAIVNPVNCVGTMGKGLALEFKHRYPTMFAAYRDLCFKKELTLGGVMVFTDFDPVVVCLPTKQHWRDGSSLEIVERGLKTLIRCVAGEGWTRVALPALGCGYGGLEFEPVLALCVEHLGPAPATFLLYKPHE